jgi:hypothetical protein
LQAVTALFSGKLKLTGLEVFSDINDRTFDDLPDELKTILRVRPTLRAVIVLRQSDVDVKFEVFKRLNTGGVKLNAQEIRNSTYTGPLNDLILKLSEHPRFHELLGIKSKTKSKMHQEMRDAELVLRYFTFRTSWDSFNGGMMRQLDHFMARKPSLKAGELKELEQEFHETVEKVAVVFGDSAFQRWQPEKQGWRRQVLASLFDAQMIALRGYEVEQLALHKDEIITAFKGLFSDEDFRKSIDAATNAPSFLRHRISKLRDLVASAIGE